MLVGRPVTLVITVLAPVLQPEALIRSELENIVGHGAPRLLAARRGLRRTAFVIHEPLKAKLASSWIKGRKIQARTSISSSTRVVYLGERLLARVDHGVT